MLKPIALAIAFLSISINLIAQGYDVTFSEEIKLKGKDKAYTQEIIGEDEDYLFLLLTDKSAGSYSSNQIFIQKIDKNTLKIKQQKGIYSSNSEKRQFPYRSLFKTKDGFVIFLETSKKNVNEVYAMRLDNDLNLALERKKIYTYNSKEEDTRLLSNTKTNDFVLLSQKYVEEGQRIDVVYTAYDEEFFQTHTGQIPLEVVSKVSQKRARKRSLSVLDDFDFTAKSELISLIRISIDNAPDRFELSFVNTNTGDNERLPVSLSNNAYFDDYRLIISGDELILSGFYSDEVERNRILSSKTYKAANSDLNGTFFQRYRISDRMMLSNTQTPFDVEFLNYISDNNPALKPGLFSINLFGKKDKNEDEEDLSDNYRIRNVVYNTENQYATFYCEYVSNTVHTSTSTNANGVTTTSTTYRSIRGNLFYYRISLKDGKMQWFNTVRKYENYSSSGSYVWYIKSLDVLPKESGDLIFYKTSRVFNENDPSDLKGEKIKTKKLEQNFFTSIVNPRDGSYENYLPSLSSQNLKGHMKVQLDEKFRSAYGQSVFTINTKYSLKPQYYPLYLILSYIRLFGAEVYSEKYTVARIDY